MSRRQWTVILGALLDRLSRAPHAESVHAAGVPRSSDPGGLTQSAEPDPFLPEPMPGSREALRRFAQAKRLVSESDAIVHFGWDRIPLSVLHGWREPEARA